MKDFVRIPTPNFDAWILAELELRLAEKHWAVCVQKISRSEDERTEKAAQSLTLNEKRKATHELFRPAMREMKEVAESLQLGFLPLPPPGKPSPG